jgi:hypothetical protein
VSRYELQDRLLLALKQLALVIIILQVQQNIDQPKAVRQTLVALEDEYGLGLCVVRDEDEFVLHLIVGISDALLLGKEICELLLIVDAILDLAELGEFSFELFLVHLLVEVLSHDLDELGPRPEHPLGLGVHLLDELIGVVLLQDDRTCMQVREI